MPRYGELARVYRKQREDYETELIKLDDMKQNDPDHGDYYQMEIDRVSAILVKLPKFGHEALDIPASKFPCINEVHEELTWYFDAKYCNERPAYETPELFTAQMQCVFNDIAYEMEQKLAMYKKVLPIFEEQFMGTRIHSGFTNGGWSKDQASDLPDVPTPDTFAHLQSKNERQDGGERWTLDESIPTRLSNILTLANVNLNIMPAYLNSYSHLFMTMVI